LSFSVLEPHAGGHLTEELVTVQLPEASLRQH
jgi:hypothetical protein